MNAHPKLAMPPSRSSTARHKISQAELAQFLARLAAIYRDPKTGNPRLSTALFELSEQMMQAKNTTKRSRQLKSDRTPHKQAAFEWLRGLDAEAVRRFISDETKTKSELIELASERFSIPRSRLMKISTQNVREDVLAALLHEESLRIISSEAERSGANRSS